MKISLCIPTNGVKEWVFPVLKSIYDEPVDEEQFQVVVTDNGDNEEFYRDMMQFRRDHANLVYERTNAPLFLNEIAAYKRAAGSFIKFVNHRTVLLPNTLCEWICFVEDHIDEKPAVYFSEGMLRRPKDVFSCNDFDSFVKTLSYWSSWSTGMGFWKEDFDKITENEPYNELFPHTTILFHERKKRRYVIDNRVMLKEIPTGNTPKGCYDLFYAFSVEYLSILLQLCRDGDLSIESFLKIKEENLEFVAGLYEEFVQKGMYCSYDLSGYEESIRVFYSHRQIMDMLDKMRESRF